MKYLLILTCLLVAAAGGSPGDALGGEPGATGGIRAFPGAEGFGAASKGGRGGRVIKVTNLKSKGPGSLQWACNQDGPRIVVFEVSGVIKGDLTIRHGQLTLAGQTAPGAGITIDGKFACSPKNMKGGERLKDVIVRFLRVRPRPRARHGYDAAIFFGIDNLMVDHMSASWGEDETLSLTGCGHYSMQWCAVEPSALISEGGVAPHNYGTLIGYTQKPMGIHHTLYAHHDHRTPAVSGKNPGVVDLRNNVIYNVAGTTYLIFKGAGANMVGCYHQEGPGGSCPKTDYIAPPAYAMGGFRTGGGIREPYVYLKGNYSTLAGGYSWLRGPKVKRVRRPDPVPFASVKTHVAEQARELVLAHAGCLPRDAVSARTIKDVRARTGSWGRHLPKGGLMEGLTAGKPAADADKDGMPDAWEKAHGLDPDSVADAKKIVPAGASRGDRHKGYTYIEYCINDRADQLIANAVARARRKFVHGLQETEPLDWSPPGDWKKPAPEEESPRVAKLIATLKRSDKELGRYSVAKKFSAARLLCFHEGLCSEKSTKAVIALLKHEDLSTRRSAAWVLGCMNPAPKGAAPALVASMLAHEEKKIKGGGCFEAWALGQIGPAAAKESVPALIKVRSVRAKASAAFALMRMGAEAEPAMGYLIGSLRGQDFGGSKYCAAKALARIGEPAIPVLIKGRGGATSVTNPWAARALGWMGPKAKSAGGSLAKALASKSLALQQAAAKALAMIGSDAPEAVPALSKALKDPNWLVRYSAAKGLVRIGAKAKGAVGDLTATLDDDEFMVRAAAAEALGRIGPAAKAAAGKLAAVLGGDKHDWPRFNAARALGLVCAPQGVDALSKALSDSDADVRAEAAWALGDIGPAAKGAAAALRMAAKSDSEYLVQHAAEATLAKIDGK